MSREEAIKIAQVYVDQMNAESDYSNELTYVVKEPIETDLGYYFDHTFEAIDKENPPMMAGAPGFIVSKSDGQATVLSWPEYSALLKSLNL